MRRARRPVAGFPSDSTCLTLLRLSTFRVLNKKVSRESWRLILVVSVMTADRGMGCEWPRAIKKARSEIFAASLLGVVVLNRVSNHAILHAV